MKKALSLLLSATMVLGLTQQATMFAHAENQEKGIVKGPGYEINFNEVKQSQGKHTFDVSGLNVDPDERVKVIVKFKNQPLVDKFLKSGQEDYSEYAKKNAVTVEKVENKVEDLADQVVEATDLKGKKNDAEILETYSVLLTGCAVELPFKQIEKIEEMKGVEEVFLSHKYEVPKTDFKVENQPNMLTTHDMIGSKNAWGLGTGYDGTGMVVAVIDTGIDYNHEAFKTMPTNVRFSAKDVQAILNKENMACEKAYATYGGGLVASENGGSKSVYKSAKIPFAFDYVDVDTDAVPVNTQYHGTHVAGTVAANCEKIKGVAPNAQLIAMKVFPDAGGAMDDDIMEALEDSVRLNVDSINMSLGTSSGFSKYGDSVLQQAYEAVEKVGINLNISAGNSYNSAFGNNHNHLEPASLPDEGIVGSPSTLEGALSVAAINNTHLGPSNFIELENGVVGYTDASDSNDKPFTKIGKGTFEVVDCGKGTQADFAKANVKGKIAIVQRGENTFQEKHDNAAAAGAKAVIVYNHSSGSLKMSIEGFRIPAVFVTKNDGLQILKEGKFKYDPSKKDNVSNPDAWMMCDFSSIGCTPSLEIKPEITAPGGQIYSAFYAKDGESVYGAISGTSMASPHIAGATALVREYAKEKYPNLNQVELTNLVNNLAMSTAKPVTQADGIFYSPRKQGAGIMQVDNAIKTPAYLTVEGAKRPKAEVGYNEEGRYSYTVTVHNTSDKAVTYDVKTTAMAETSQVVDDEVFTTENDEDITKYCTISQEGTNNGKVTVAAGSTANVKVTIKLDMNSDKVKAIQKDFVNGFFVEGFTQFLSEEEVDLSVPFMGFCGDWAKAPVFDSTLYDKSAQPEYGKGSKLGLHVSGSECEDAGINVFKANHGFGTEYAEQCICIKGSDRLVPLTNLLRGAEKLEYKITNPNGKVVFSQTDNYIGKTYYTGSDETPFACAEYWMKVTPLFEPGKGAVEGTYTYDITATVGGTNGKGKQTLTYHFAIDQSLPVWDKNRTAYYEEDGKRYLRLSLSDNNGLAGVALLKDSDWDDYAFTSIAFDYKEGEGKDTREQVICLGTTQELKNKGVKDNIVLQAFDYANNYQKYRVYLGTKPEDIENPDPEQPQTLKATTLSKVENTGVGEMTLTYSKVDKATGYEIYRAVGDGEFDKIADTTKTVYVDKNATKKGETYSYKVVAYNENGKAEASNVLSAVSEMQDQPVEPKELASTELLSVVNTAYGTMKLDYTDVAGATGYKILRAEGEDGTFTSLGTTEENYFIDKTATTVGQTYSYKVVAFNDEQEAKESNVVSAISGKEKPQSELEAPTLISVTNTKKGVMELQWTKVEGANGYYIYRAIGDGEFQHIESTSATKYTDKTAKKYGQTYSYYIVAYKWSGQTSDKSNVVECENEIGGLKAPSITDAYYNAETKTIVLEFTEVENAIRYNIYRAVDDEERLQSWAKAEHSPWEDKWELEPGHTYSYRIEAEGYESGNYSKPSNEVHVVIPAEGEDPEPEKPTLDAAIIESVENTGVGEMTVKFGAVDKATGYRVFRSVDAGLFEEVADITDTTYVDETATQRGSVYAYYVVAYNDEVTAEQSNTMSAVSEKVKPLLATTITKVENTDYNEMTVTFTEVEGAVAYRVYRSVDGAEFEQVADITGTTYVDKKADKVGATYAYKVVAYNAETEAQESEVVTAVSEKEVLDAAILKSVTNTAYGEMTVVFDAVEKATGYKVFRSVDAGAFVQVADITKTTYVDTTATQKGSVYAYYVVAYNAKETAEKSNTMSAVSEKVKPLEATTVTKVENTKINEMTVTFTAVEGAEAYKVYRSVDGAAFELVADVKTTTYVDKNASKLGATYAYKVVAYNSETEAKESNVVKAVTTLKPEEETLDSVKGFYVARFLIKFYEVGWNKVKGATGYEVYRKAGNGKYQLIERTKKTSITDVPSLLKNKTFTYKVRAYKVVNGKKVYGGYSKEITIKTVGLFF